MPQNNDEQMVLGSEAFDCGIQKSLVHAGKTPVEFVDGTKVNFIRTQLFWKYSVTFFLIWLNQGLFPL